EEPTIMYAIIKSGGKQHRVAQGQDIMLEKLQGDVGESIVFDQVLLTSDGENVKIGNPYLENVRVIGRLKRHGKSRKIVVFKFKKRKGYRRTRGHRQEYSLIKIDSIES
ncbi:MAG: 50S ribosomal protein L21, partial [Pseudomonadota bacterium]